MPCVKIPHPTREAALEHLKALVWKNQLSGDTQRSAGLSVYPCETHTHAWHVGHQQGAPLVWHYTISDYLDRILEADQLRPRNPARRSIAVSEPEPMLWFSWNQQWDHSVMKVSVSVKSSIPHGRALSELVGRGLVRFGAPASVAKLRWNDYLARNRTPHIQRDLMATRGNPAEWLATDEPVPLDACRRFEVYMAGWVDGASVEDADFDAYLEERAYTYGAALARLRPKIRDLVDHDTNVDYFLDLRAQVEDEAELILLEDLNVDFAGYDFFERQRREHPEALQAWAQQAAHDMRVNRARRIKRARSRT
jgi:hypothetical protein